MKPRHEFLQVWYPSLLLILIASLYIYNTSSRHADFFLSLSTTVIGILLTVFLIDRVLRKQHDAELDKYRLVALRRLRGPIESHINMLQKIYMASAHKLPDPVWSSLEEFFSDDRLYETVLWFDALKPAPVEPEIQWYKYICHEVKEFKAELGHISDRYAVYMPYDLLVLIESLSRSWFFSFIENYPSRLKYQYSANISPVMPMFPVIINVDNNDYEDAAPHLKLHTNRLMALIRYYNGKVPTEERIILKHEVWTYGNPPIWGSARFERE
jgi:hypothetical protein